jgi:outer membrane protein OmpA-like peptidoglycan-associated protein
MKRRSGLALGVLLAVWPVMSLLAEPYSFTYEYVAGEQYRILSTVEQDVSVNGVFSHHATILNRIAIEVIEVADGRGYHVGSLQTSEEAYNESEAFGWGEQYHTEFWRDERGYYEIDDEYYMPVVRDVPVFPDRSLEQGDTWSADGLEVHDFRRGFGLSEPFRFPIPVSYEYLGRQEVEGRMLPTVAISYNVFHRVSRRYEAPLYPVRITGYSDQLLHWDPELGRPHSYSEEYAFIFTLSDGQDVLYEGTAAARVVESSRLNREEVAEDIRRELDERGFEDQEVVVDDLGVTLRLDSILFPGDSAYLWESERQKLDQIAEILARYPERDMLITGHTALRGTPESRERLSAERAAAVGEYLLSIGARERDQMIYRGMGARQPVADNTTEAGARLNRRVEITILEN